MYTTRMRLPPPNKNNNTFLLFAVIYSIWNNNRLYKKK